MTKIEYDGHTLHVPESWKDITLGEYETFYTDKPTTARGRVELIAKICKIDADLLLSWPTNVFDEIVKFIMFIYDDHEAEPSAILNIDGAAYAVAVEDRLTLGAWVDADEAQKNSAAPLSNTLAIVCRPVGESYDYQNNVARQAMFAALPVSEVLPVMAFFLRCKQILEKRMRVYSSLCQMADLLPPSIKTLRSLGVGTKLFRMWPIIKYCILTELLRFQLRKFSRTYNTVKTKTSQKPHKGT